MPKAKILIIDDEKQFCCLLEEFLSEEGFTVECAYDGQEGIEKAKTFIPDLILLDHRMPTMGGLEAIKIIKQFSTARIYCVSAITDNATIDESFRLGVDEYICKPVDLDDLLTKIQSGLSQ